MLTESHPLLGKYSYLNLLIDKSISRFNFLLIFYKSGLFISKGKFIFWSS